MPKNDKYLPINPYADIAQKQVGLGVIFDENVVEIEELPRVESLYERERANVRFKPLKIARLKAKPKNGDAPFLLMPYHAESGAGAGDNLKRDDEQQQGLHPAIVQLFGANPDCDKLVLVGDINKSFLRKVVVGGVTSFAVNVGTATAAATLADLPNHGLLKIIVNLTGGTLAAPFSGPFILSAIEGPEYIIDKGRVAENLWLNQQADKGGDIDSDSKTGMLVLSRRPLGMSDIQVEAQTRALLNSLMVPLEPPRVFGALGVYTHGSDHSPLRVATVNSVTVGAHPLIPSEGGMGFKPPEETYVQPLTDDDKKAQSEASHVLIRALRTYCRTHFPAETAALDQNKFNSFKGFANIFQAIAGNAPTHPFSAHLRANPNNLRDILLGWVRSDEYKIANALMHKNKSQLITEEEVGILRADGTYADGTLMRRLLDKPAAKPDIINTIAEFLKGQVSSGYQPMVGVDPRLQQLVALERAPEAICIVCDNGPDAHLNCEKQMAEVISQRNTYSRAQEEVAAMKSAVTTVNDAGQVTVTVNYPKIIGNKPLEVEIKPGEPVAVATAKAIGRRFC